MTGILGAMNWPPPNLSMPPCLPPSSSSSSSPCLRPSLPPLLLRVGGGAAAGYPLVRDENRFPFASPDCLTAPIRHPCLLAHLAGLPPLLVCLPASQSVQYSHSPSPPPLSLSPSPSAPASRPAAAISSGRQGKGCQRPLAQEVSMRSPLRPSPLIP